MTTTVMTSNITLARLVSKYLQKETVIVSKPLSEDEKIVLAHQEDGNTTSTAKNLKSCLYVYCAGSVFWECCPDKVLPHDCFTPDNCGTLYC